MVVHKNFKRLRCNIFIKIRAHNFCLKALPNWHPTVVHDLLLVAPSLKCVRKSYVFHKARLPAVAPLDLWLHTNAFGLCWLVGALDWLDWGKRLMGQHDAVGPKHPDPVVQPRSLGSSHRYDGSPRGRHKHLPLNSPQDEWMLLEVFVVSEFHWLKDQLRYCPYQGLVY